MVEVRKRDGTCQVAHETSGSDLLVCRDPVLVLLVVRDADVQVDLFERPDVLDLIQREIKHWAHHAGSTLSEGRKDEK